MKRTLSLFVLLLMAGLNLSAQSLNATWRTFFDDDDNPDGYFVYYTFTSSSDVTVKITTRMNTELGVIDLSVTWTGSYQRSGNSLTIKLDGKTAKPKVEDAVWSKDMALEFHRNPGMEDLVKAMLSEQMSENMKDSEDAFNGTYQILDLQNDVLMLKRGSEVLTFARMRR